MFSRLLHFLALASTVLATVTVIAYGPDHSKCLDTTPQGLFNRAMVYDCNASSPHQNWLIKPDYTIQSRNTEYCLGPFENKPERGAFLTEIDCDDAQAWHISESEYTLGNTDLCMVLYEGDTANPVQLGDCDPTYSHWEYTYTEPRIFMTIQYEPDNSKCLENTTQGAMLRDCSSSHQNWTTTRDIGGLIASAIPGKTNLCLDVNGTSSKGSNLTKMPCRNARGWTYNTDSNQYKYHNTNLCMDLYEGNMENQVQLWDCDPTSNLTNQKWIQNVLGYF